MHGGFLSGIILWPLLCPGGAHTRDIWEFLKIGGQIVGLLLQGHPQDGDKFRETAIYSRLSANATRPGRVCTTVDTRRARKSARV